jgi:hypothetical protein
MSAVEQAIYAAAFALALSQIEAQLQREVMAHRAGMDAVDAFRKLNDAQRARVSG